MSRDLRNARLRAAEALENAGATIETISLRSMRRALELYLAVLKLEAGVSVAELIVAEGSAAVTIRSCCAARARTRARCGCCS